MALPDNPTAVSGFTGRSDDGVAAAAFQKLWDSGLKDDQGKDSPPPVVSPTQETATAAGAADSAPVPTVVSQEPEAASSESEYTSVEDYLAKAGIDSESFYKLPQTIKVDGQTRQVPLSEVLKNYQLDSHVTQKSQAFADRQREWEATQKQAQSAWEARLSTAENLGKLALQQLNAEFAAVNWTKLYQEDPARYDAENIRFQLRQNQIQGQLGEIEKGQKALAAERSKEIESQIPQERERLLEKIPAWRDSKVFEADKAKMLSAGKQIGFSDAELGEIRDHRYMQVLHYAASWLALQAQTPAALKQVRAAPKMVSPGARTQSDPQRVALTQAREALQRNPRDQNAQTHYAEALIRAGKA